MLQQSFAQKRYTLDAQNWIACYPPINCTHVWFLNDGGNDILFRTTPGDDSTEGTLRASLQLVLNSPPGAPTMADGDWRFHSTRAVIYAKASTGNSILIVSALC